MNPRLAALIGVLVLVLVAAVVGARLLLNAPVEVPPVPLAEPMAPSPVAPRVVVERSPRPEARPDPAPVPAQAAPPVEEEQPYIPPSEVEEAVLPPDPPLPPAIEAAWVLVRSDRVSVEQAREAAELFSECLRTNPSDWRCASGLKLARGLQLPRPPPEFKRVIRPELEHADEEAE